MNCKFLDLPPKSDVISDKVSFIYSTIYRGNKQLIQYLLWAVFYVSIDITY